MIPKIIHYCWFGRKPKPKNVLDYIKTWIEHNSDYKIKEWNEDNFDIHCCKYVLEAYNVKKYAFVSDYARLYALYTEGGFYLDTDIEVRNSFDDYLNYKTVLGWEADYIGTGMLGCVKGQNWTREMIKKYHQESFITWLGKLNTKPNPYRLSDVLVSYGLVMNREKQILKDDITIFTLEYFCAHLADHTQYYITDNTVCIHHYFGTWSNKNNSFFQKLMYIINNIIIKIKLCM